MTDTLTTSDEAGVCATMPSREREVVASPCSTPAASSVTSEATHAKLDLLEAWMRARGPVTPPEPVHRFTPGLYSRELTMAAGLLLNSKIHRTEHQYIVSRGVALVFDEEQGWHPVVAPYHGITKPGTRRTLYILEETTWTTFHPMLPDEPRDVDVLEARLIEPHVAIPFDDEDVALIEAEVARWQDKTKGLT